MPTEEDMEKYGQVADRYLLRQWLEKRLHALFMYYQYAGSDRFYHRPYSLISHSSLPAQIVSLRVESMCLLFPAPDASSTNPSAPNPFFALITTKLFSFLPNIFSTSFFTYSTSTNN